MQLALDPQILADARRLTLVSRRHADSDLAGAFHSAFRGQGLQFSELREYQPGDDVRRIDWKVAARSSRIYVKSFEEDRSLRVLCALDVSSSAGAGSAPTAYARGARIVAMLSLLAARSRDAFGLIRFTHSPVEYLAPSQRRRQLMRVLLALSNAPLPGQRTNVNAALQEILRRERRRAVVFLLSDFHSPAFHESLQLLARRHDVVAVWLAPPTLDPVPAIGLVQVRDSESGELLTLDSSSAHVRRTLALRATQREESLRQVFRSAGADFCAIRNDCFAPLHHLMEQRAHLR